MRRMKLSALFLVVALGVAAVGSAALTTVDFTRNASGQVLTDIDENAAVSFSSPYQNLLLPSGTSGEYRLDLNAAISDVATEGYNTNAIFTLGKGADGAFQITNNSDINITVALAGTGSSLETGSTTTVEPGQTEVYNVVVNTENVAAGTPLAATLTIAAE